MSKIQFDFAHDPTLSSGADSSTFRPLAIEDRNAEEVSDEPDEPVEVMGSVKVSEIMYFQNSSFEYCIFIYCIVC
jgi:hypothetical protein